MDIRKLQRAIVDGLEDRKAHNIVVFNTEHLSPLFERVIIATGTSNRQTKSIAASVRDAVKDRGLQVLRTEGEENGEWIIVDCGAAVAHIMQPTIREYYHLEEIWGGKNVNMKLGDTKPARSAAPGAVAKPKAAKPTVAKRGAPAKASSRAKMPAPAVAKKAAPKKPVAKASMGKAAAGKVSLGKAAPRKAAAVKSAATKKPVARKTTAAAKPATAKTAVRKAPAKKAAPASSRAVRRR